MNTAMLGAFIKATGLLPLKSVEDAVKEKFRPDIAEKNISAVRKAYEQTKV